MTEYVTPERGIPPQLTRADLDALTPQQVVKAHQAGQFETIMTGRDPLPFEASGTRWATEAEDAAARIDQAAAAQTARAAAAEELRRQHTTTTSQETR